MRRLGVTQELLSLVTGLAHYLKLLIRICLQGALKLERDTGTDEGLHRFLDQIGTLEAKLAEADATQRTRDYVQASADGCAVCEKPVEDKCFAHGERVFHLPCMVCANCHKDLNTHSAEARWFAKDSRLLCRSCCPDTSPAAAGFTYVTRLQQYVHLLRVAHARLLATIRTSGALPHTSGKYRSSNLGRRKR